MSLYNCSECNYANGYHRSTCSRMLRDGRQFHASTPAVPDSSATEGVADIMNRVRRAAKLYADDQADHYHAELKAIESALYVGAPPSPIKRTIGEIPMAAASVSAKDADAWMTRNDDGDPAMLFFDKQEAMQYTDGEAPEALILRDVITPAASKGAA